MAIEMYEWVGSLLVSSSCDISIFATEVAQEDSPATIASSTIASTGYKTQNDNPDYNPSGDHRRLSGYSSIILTTFFIAVIPNSGR